MRDFHEYALALLQKRRLSIRKFASAVGNNPTFISQILRKQRRPPLKHMWKWVEVLELQGPVGDEFLDAAALAHTPERVVHLLRDKGHSLARLERSIHPDGTRRKTLDRPQQQLPSAQQDD